MNGNLDPLCSSVSAAYARRATDMRES